MGQAKKAQIRGFEHDLGMQEKSNLFNVTQAQKAWERERQAIREQNLYNSPANQMARFKEAGLNPNLIYGQGDSGNQSKIAEYQGQTADYSKVRSQSLPAELIRQQQQDALNALLNVTAQTASIRKLEAETSSIKKYRNPLLEAQTLGQDWKGEETKLSVNMKRNLYGVESGQSKHPSALGNEMLKYNQQTDKRRDLELQGIENKAKLDWLKSEINRGDIDKQQREIYQSWYDRILSTAGLFLKK